MFQINQQIFLLLFLVYTKHKERFLISRLVIFHHPILLVLLVFLILHYLVQMLAILQHVVDGLVVEMGVVIEPDDEQVLLLLPGE